ncbi:LPS export ABC transporter ATP-binding protein [uncultured Ferrimonas sp.]|uniref:LPS export ABC transporter ATP-binding protein n=1 Tax=uncultured Ferrimonas sp. TaxID=432640 RepID=UPI0026358025|nr:LPS export ABC transporter ATP-binding protein [uncultured Ferrimonas sp.]
MTPTVLEAQQLAKSYNGRQVVKNVGLKVETGQIVGLLGPNGAGKTTTFYMVVGLVQNDQGRILINNEEITLLPMHSRARKGIGYLPQESSIFRKLTVYENLMAVLEIRKELSKEQRIEKLEQLLEEFNITHIRDSLGMALSGGERRRVEIARALAAEPQFILLDEPFAGVDPISVIDIKKIIQHLKQRGLGVLITDHNVRETLDVCEYAYIVSHGEMIAQGAPEEVLNDQLVRSVYLGDQFKL